MNVPSVTAGQSASFALKKVKRQDIRKGMVMLQKTDTPPVAVREFVAEGNQSFCPHLTSSHDIIPPNHHQTKIPSDAACKCYCSNMSDSIY